MRRREGSLFERKRWVQCARCGTWLWTGGVRTRGSPYDSRPRVLCGECALEWFRPIPIPHKEVSDAGSEEDF